VARELGLPTEAVTGKDHYEPPHRTEFEQPSLTNGKILVTPLVVSIMTGWSNIKDIQGSVDDQ